MRMAWILIYVMNFIDELATYGVISEADDGMCEIANPIYLYSILQAFKTGSEWVGTGISSRRTLRDGFRDYLTAIGQIEMPALLDNFRDFIARAGFKILQVPDTPQESVGRHLLLAYLEQFVKRVGGMMHIEVQTGRGQNGPPYYPQSAKIYRRDKGVERRSQLSNRQKAACGISQIRRRAGRVLCRI